VWLIHSFVWCSYAYCDEHSHECNFGTQSAISTRTTMIYTRRLRCWHVWVWLWHESDYDTQNHTMRVEITLVCDVYSHNVMHTCTSVIFWNQSVIFARSVWFLPAEWNYTQKCDNDTYNCDKNTQKCNNDTYNCDLKTHKSDLYTQSVKLTRMSVIMTLTKVIKILIRVKTTLCV
jgi:hypothetical protein